MSKISVDTITDEAGTGAPDFPNGISATGPFTSLGIDDNATSTAITVDSAGKLGVGTASPTEKLDVAGTVKATSFSGDGSTLTGISNPIKAWVNFNGTGVVAIRDSLNVSSITDNGTGKYSVAFVTNLTDVNFAATATVSRDTAETSPRVINIMEGSISVSGFNVEVRAAAGSLQDNEIISTIIVS